MLAPRGLSLEELRVGRRGGVSYIRTRGLWLPPMADKRRFVSGEEGKTSVSTLPCSQERLKTHQPKPLAETPRLPQRRGPERWRLRTLAPVDSLVARSPNRRHFLFRAQVVHSLQRTKYTAEKMYITCFILIMPYDFQDPRFLFLLQNVPIPPEVRKPERTPIVLTPSLDTFGQFYSRSPPVRALTFDPLSLPFTRPHTDLRGHSLRSPAVTPRTLTPAERHAKAKGCRPEEPEEESRS